MAIAYASQNAESRPAGRPERKSAQGRVAAALYLAAIFMGLIVLPQTRADIWWPSSAGDSGFLVGP